MKLQLCPPWRLVWRLTSWDNCFSIAAGHSRKRSPRNTAKLSTWNGQKGSLSRTLPQSEDWDAAVEACRVGIELGLLP